MSLVFLLILLAGVMLIYVGLRGTQILTELRCARCDYIVEYLKDTPEPRCPECGSDLELPNSVRFGRIRRRPAWAIAGVLTLAFALALPATYRFWTARRRQATAVTLLTGANGPTATLLKDLRAKPYDFGTWEELERRQGRAQMSPQEISQAVEILIARFEAEPDVQRSSFRGDAFLVSALATDSLSADQHLRLAQAFHGRDPVVQLQPQCHAGDLVEFGVTRKFFSTLSGATQLTALKEVTVDGKSMAVYPRRQDDGVMDKNKFSSADGTWFDGRLWMDLPLGRHTITFYFDRGTTNHSDPFTTGNFSTPGQADIWPPTLSAWESAVSVPIDVVPSDSSTVQEVTDLVLAPRQGLEIATHIDVFMWHETKSTVQLNMVFRDLKVPLCGDLFTDLDGERIRLGSIQAEGSETTQQFKAAIPRLGPDVRTLDLMIVPDLLGVEKKTKFKRVWASPVALLEVPIIRRDLEGIESQPNQH